MNVVQYIQWVQQHQSQSAHCARAVRAPSKCRAHALAPNVHLGDVILLTSCRTMATRLYYHTIAQCHPLSCRTQSKVLETAKICCPIHVP
jgi:ribosomal protein S17